MESEVPTISAMHWDDIQNIKIENIHHHLYKKYKLEISTVTPKMFMDYHQIMDSIANTHTFDC